MKDPWNPTKEEIRQWAYESDKFLPPQDWELVVGRIENSKLLLELTCDETCPQNIWALSCLYFLVGDYIRRKIKPYSLEDLLNVLEEAKKSNVSYVTRWVEKSYDLIKDPERFNYNEWCNGELANEEKVR